MRRILEAIKRENEVPANEIVLIYSDSMSLAKSLANNHWKDTDPRLKLSKRNVARHGRKSSYFGYRPAAIWKVMRGQMHLPALEQR